MILRINKPEGQDGPGTSKDYIVNVYAPLKLCYATDLFITSFRSA